MKNLSNIVYDYYFSHRAKLSEQAQFHLASRVYLWNQDLQAKELLLSMQDWYTAGNNPEAMILQAITEGQNYFSGRVITAMARRQPYFDRYPLLLPANVTLFRMLFSETIYHIDLKHLFYSHFEKQDIQAMRAALLADSAGLAVLSTHAVTFLYTVDRFIENDETSLPLERFLEIGASYDLSDRDSLLLFLYFYTHCIIAESLFYARALPHKNLALYRHMMTELERAIDINFVMINLDSKFEFLVAAELVGFTSRLRQRILQEASQSLSQEGDWLIDSVNDATNKSRVSFDKSEHRNVLFLLSQQPFNPLLS